MILELLRLFCKYFIKCWYPCFIFFFVVWTVLKSNVTLAELAYWQFEVLLLVWIIFAIPLGFLIAIPVGAIVLPPIYSLFLWSNGGELKEGELVKVLVGPHKGEIARVYSVGQRSDVRVELGEEARENFTDYFEQFELIRVKRSEREEGYPR